MLPLTFFSTGMGTSSHDADTVMSIFPNPMNRFELTVVWLPAAMIGSKPP